MHYYIKAHLASIVLYYYIVLLKRCHNTLALLQYHKTIPTSKCQSQCECQCSCDYPCQCHCQFLCLCLCRCQFTMHRAPLCINVTIMKIYYCTIAVIYYYTSALMILCIYSSSIVHYVYTIRVQHHYTTILSLCIIILRHIMLV